MVTKALLFSAILNLTVAVQLFAQKDTAMLYMQEVGSNYNLYVARCWKPAMKKEDATFIRVLLSPENDSSLYRVNDYYLNGKIKFSGESLSPMWNAQFHGTCVEYFDNGHKKMIATYNKGMLVGDLISYFPNGRVDTVKDMGDGNMRTYIGDHNGFLKECLDSLGTIVAENGNGKWIE